MSNTVPKQVIRICSDNDVQYFSVFTSAKDTPHPYPMWARKSINVEAFGNAAYSPAFTPISFAPILDDATRISIYAYNAHCVRGGVPSTLSCKIVTRGLLVYTPAKHCCPLSTDRGHISRWFTAALHVVGDETLVNRLGKTSEHVEGGNVDSKKMTIAAHDCWRDWATIQAGVPYAFYERGGIFTLFIFVNDGAP